MRNYIERVRDQAPMVPNAKAAREDTLYTPFKPRNLDLYYGNRHMECYYFYQQCNNHFEVAGSLGYKRVLFATGFLKDCILNCEQQHKTRMQQNQLATLSQDKFKAFLRKSLEESNVFVDDVWAKIRRDAEHLVEEV